MNLLNRAEIYYKTASEKIVLKPDDISYSAIMRKINQHCPDVLIEFMKRFKVNFDHAYVNDKEAPEKIALEKSIQFLNSKQVFVAPLLEKKAYLERFVEVVPGLYRGSAPALKDVVMLKDDQNVRKIISLDLAAGSFIEPICKSLGIEQVMLPIDGTKESVDRFMKHDIEQLLISNGPVYVHCRHGKDRTGFAVALLRMRQGMSFDQAYSEALSFGFGKGVDPKFMNNLISVLKQIATTPVVYPRKQIETDENMASDIVDASREFSGDPRDSVIEGDQPGSFAPMHGQTRRDQYDPVYNQVNDQSPTRENYLAYKHPKGLIGKQISLPSVGVTSMDNGKGLGTPETIGGFIHE